MKMIKPINGMLLVKEEEASEKTTAAGIILSATVTDLGPKKSKDRKSTRLNSSH